MLSAELFEKAYKMLKVDEGVRYFPYNDFDGKPVKLGNGKVTIGIGRNLEAKPISEEVVKLLFLEDFNEAYSGVTRLVKHQLLSENQFLAMLNLVFNLGETKLRNQFSNTLADINRGDFKSAARRLRTSLWYKQVKGRAERVLSMLEDGAYPY